MLLLLTFALGALMVGAWRAFVMRRVERECAARLPTAAYGIIAGAGSIALGGAEAREAVLLLHGFGDTPQTLHYLARDLHARGYTVLAPLLPGHGRTLRTFTASSADEWLACAREALRTMRARHARVGVVGLSMGGALATLLAAESAGLPALVLIAPYLDAPRHVRRAARFAPLIGVAAPYVGGRGGDRSIHDPAERARSLAYGATTTSQLRELVRTADRARSRLSRITAPTLIVQSREDNRIAPSVAEAALGALGASEKRLEWIAGCGHVITVDYGRERVSELAGDWLDAHLRALRRDGQVA